MFSFIFGTKMNRSYLIKYTTKFENKKEY